MSRPYSARLALAERQFAEVMSRWVNKPTISDGATRRAPTFDELHILYQDKRNDAIELGLKLLISVRTVKLLYRKCFSELVPHIDWNERIQIVDKSQKLVA